MDVSELFSEPNTSFSELSCFHHEWGLHPSYVTDNGGKVDGDVVDNVVENKKNVVENIVDSIVEKLSTVDTGK